MERLNVEAYMVDYVEDQGNHTELRWWEFCGSREKKLLVFEKLGCVWGGGLR